MIDIHSHILPALDDGARSLDESLAMVRIAADDGITQMIATPHAFNGLSHDPNTEEILRRVDALQAVVGSDIEILPGNEVRYTGDILGRARDGRLTTLNRQQYTLVEFPTERVPHGARKHIRHLSEEGMTPILAHPERNHEVQRRPDVLSGLIEAGALVQVTAMSITGKFGDAAFVCARLLLTHGAVHFIATDAHDAKKRLPVLSEARVEAEALLGPDRARILVDDNPSAVVLGRVIHTELPSDLADG